MAFAELSSIEHGFAPVYRERLEPLFEAMEQTRLERVGKLKTTSKAIVAICLLVIVSLWLLAGADDFAIAVMLTLGMAAILGPFVLWRIMSDRWSLSIAETIMPVICDHLGTLSYCAEAETGFAVREMEAIWVVPHYEAAELSHQITGSYRSTAFELVWARLLDRRRKGQNEPPRTPVFEGLLLRISVPEPAPGQILITQARGRLAKLAASLIDDKLHPVGYDDEEFEENFNVLASEPVAARNYLSPATLRNLLVIARSENPQFGARLLTAGFDGGWFYIALRRSGKFLQMRNITQSLADGSECVHSAFAEIEMIHRIVDQLHASG